MDTANPETEILVHITAPSRAADDANYRALAAAYLSFEPAVRTAAGSVGYGAPDDEHSTVRPVPLPSFRFGTGGSFQSLQLSFGSVADNLNSPVLRRDHAEDGHESQSSWQAPPSVIEDSIPNNDVSIARYSSPTRILEHYLQGFESSSQSNPSQSLPSAEVADKTPLPIPPHLARQVIPQTPSPCFAKRSAAQSDVVAGTSSPLPIWNTSPLTRHEGENTSVIPSSLPTSTANFIPSSRADSEPPRPAKRQKRSLSGLNPNTPLSRSTSDIGPRQENTKRTQLARRQRARQTTDGLEIRSPEPPVDCATLSVRAVVTPKLQKLARDVDMRKRFQPKEQRRGLRPFERGYWAVDCTGWPDSVKRDAWGFLTNYISNGDAGWGVWCRRAEDYSWLRLYCWGCAVGHMHLVLYLASRRELNYTGTTWVGGDGEVVVVMEPKYQRM